ncbi:MAG: hypothetical protein E7371_01815 [Clostridiales bacterium]|nr:hypothetical protein [Clostridiales bacterium]
MRLEKREITLNEKDSLKDLLLLEKALLGQYTDALTRVTRKELRERILELVKETSGEIFWMKDLLDKES